VHEFPLLFRGCFKPILPSATAKLRIHVQCCLGCLTIEVSLVCHFAFLIRPVRLQFTDSSNATIDSEIPLFGAGTLRVDNFHGLGNRPDMLPHYIIYPLCCPATIITPNLHDSCYPLADSKNGVFGPDADLKSRHLDCLTI
jgi:hypothetical protein